MTDTTRRLDRAHRAVRLAEDLLREARAGQTGDERAQAERLARMMEDPRGKELTIALTDQAFRSRRPERIADQLAYLLDRYGAPRFMHWWERAGLILGGVIGHYMPSLVVPPILARLRHETEPFILPAEEEDLGRYVAERRAAGTRLNLNQLGEAILGEGEARRRLDAYVRLLAREDVEYISVKVSSVTSQLNLVAFDATLDVVKARLRTLYREALARRYRRPDGRVAPKFVNLDMEEYRDLDLTVRAFRDVLDEDDFAALPAGIVLQAYLPESHRVQRDLTAWAMARVARGGAPIKLRIVKGANLAMERIDAALHGWPQAPFADKAHVDANYKRMLEYGTAREHAVAVHLGVASHNLFDVAYALVLRQEEDVAPFVELEMLEGMANHQARVVQQRAGGLLLYAPVVRAEDFASAIAYLVRRLDENTAEDNFLRHVFGLEPGSPAFLRERDRFLASLDLVDTVSDAPQRTQNRAAETRRAAAAPARFERDHRVQTAARAPRDAENEPDTDWALPANRAWIASVIEAWRARPPERVPLGIGGHLLAGAEEVTRVDPSRPGRVAYRHGVADVALVSRALDTARAALPDWGGRAPDGRAALLDRAALVLAERRGDLIGAMMLDGAKTVAEADPEVSEAIDFARYYARSLLSTSRDARAGVGTRWPRVDVVDPGECATAPLGVVVIAPPWNFPLSIPAGGVLAALAAGNAVVLKPAPEAVLVGWHLASALWDAGIPRDALAFLPCADGDVGRALITDPRVDAVVLTGSAATARRFFSWRPELRLTAETSGKNAIVVTALADRDQAIRDIVHSAFGHNGQKCSAASLAICEAEVYDDPDFLRQLRDAAESLRVGSAWDAASRVTPLAQPPGEALRRALTTLDEGESWLLEPRRIGEGDRLWSPGIVLGVRRGSFFHRTECFGPVLGLMRAGDLDEAIDLANDTAFGLTSGLQSLDDREVERWVERIEAGNLYVNRPTTGAIVGRQPFGGWKASAVGGGAKAGGPNYVLQLARWEQLALPSASGRWEPGVEAALRAGLAALGDDAGAARALTASASSYAEAWHGHFAREHDLAAVLGEDNVFRYRPCRRIVARGDASTPAGRLALAQIALAALTAGVPIELSAGAAGHFPDLPNVDIVAESEAALAVRLAGSGAERLRVAAPVSRALRAAAHEAGVAVIDAAPMATGRLELRWYLREQTVSRTRHRYGNVIERAAGE